MQNRAQLWWDRGDRIDLARRVGISASYLSDILHRRRRVSWNMAKRLEEAAELLGYDVPATAWIEAERTRHPAFFGEPRVDPATPYT